MDRRKRERHVFVSYSPRKMVTSANVFIKQINGRKKGGVSLRERMRNPRVYGKGLVTGAWGRD